MTPEQALELAWAHRLTFTSTPTMGYGQDIRPYCSCGLYLDFERNYRPHLEQVFIHGGTDA